MSVYDTTESHTQDNTVNPTSGVTLNKYRNQIAWRRSKVKELLTRNYAQYEIANLLHISQPTISRDIKYIQKEIKKTTENYGEHLFETHRNTLSGLDEAIKKLWTMVDSPKTEAKEKVKAMREYYRERLNLVQSEPGPLQQKKYMDETKMRYSF